MVNVEELVDNLNTTLWRLDKEYKVFDGKCCFISYLIAKELEENGLSYNVIVYAHAGCNSSDIYKLAREEDIAHVSIQIATGNKRYIIGENLLDTKGLTALKFKLTPDELLSLYNNYTWNDDYADITDEEITDEIEMTFAMM